VPLFHIVVLAVVQGLTEFLPISSSGHLVLVPIVTGWDDQGLAIDVAVHVGSLAAVVLYFRRDIAAIASGLLRLALGQRTPAAALAGHILLATLPIIGIGAWVHAFAGDALRTVPVIGWTTLGFGLVLWLADRFGMTMRRLEHLTIAHAAFVGLAQVLALIPGTSRSGITMTAARLLGYERSEAARFSMLLSIPTIVAAGMLTSQDLYRAPSLALGIDALIAGVLAFVAALAAIAGMMRWLRHATFAPFVLYRVVLGIGLLAWFYLG
jgi:undecaprenyl-diphosphatase